jgi:hypothetical protein
MISVYLPEDRIDFRPSFAIRGYSYYAEGATAIREDPERLVVLSYRLAESVGAHPIEMFRVVDAILDCILLDPGRAPGRLRLRPLRAERRL